MSRWNKQQPVEEEELEPKYRHTLRGLNRWLKMYRYDRDIPEEGIMPAVMFHDCTESCKLHDHK